MDANSLLGTSGKDALPYEYQAQEQQAARRRSIASAMMQQSMAPLSQHNMVGNFTTQRSPFEAVNKALQSYLGYTGLASADAQQASIIQRSQADQHQQLVDVMSKAKGTPSTLATQMGPPPEGQDSMPTIGQPATPPDINGAISQAMLSQFPRVNAYGADLQTNQRKEVHDIAALIGNANTSAAVNFAQKGDPTASVPNLAAPLPVFGTAPDGSAYGLEVDNKGGKNTLKFAPKAATITNNLGDKTGAAIDLETVKRLGENLANLDKTHGKMAQLISANEFMNKGADQGGGADFRQKLRKLGQAFGVETPATGLTDANISKYGENLFDAVRALAPVTETDIPIAQAVVGSIGTDPRAMKEMTSWSLAKSMMAADEHNRKVDQAALSSDASPGKYANYKTKGFEGMNTKDPEILARAYQMMQEAGADLSKYSYGGQKITPDTKFNIDFFQGQQPAGAAGMADPTAVRPAPPGRIRVQ